MPSVDDVKPARAASLTLLLSYLGFISLGLPDTVLGAAWPAVRETFSVPLSAAGEALLLTTVCVVLSSVSSHRIAARFGAGVVLIGSTVLAAAALLTAASARVWPHMWLAALLAGLGGGAIDATLNDFVARHHSARHMTWLHACWGVGASIAPAVVAASLDSGRSWRFAYGALGVAELLMVGAFVVTRRSWQAPARAEAATASLPADVPTAPRAPTFTSTSGRARRASVLMFFLYTGVEAGTGLWASSLLTLTRGASVAAAGVVVAVYWGALTAGRVLSGALAPRWGEARLLRTGPRVALLGLLAASVPTTPIWFVAAALALVGLGLSPVYPLAMHDTPHRFPGPTGARLVGHQVAAASVGVAVVPWALGGAARAVSPLALPPLLAALAAVVVILEIVRRGGEAGRGASGPVLQRRPQAE